MMLLKIIIIEDELFVAMHLRKLINSLGYNVEACYHSAEEFLEDEDCQFDVALIDIFLSGKLTGIDAAKAIKQKNKPFIFLTANKDSETILEAAKLAPAAYLSKPFQEVEVEAALKILTIKIVSPSIDMHALLQENDFTNAPVTLRELETLKSLNQGASNIIIAERLFITKSTVKTHLRNLCTKFDVAGKTELVLVTAAFFK